MLRYLRSISTALAAAAMAGCALPPAVTAVSVALDGVSYLSSGRSATDHALSVVAAQDCILLRLVEGRWICQDFVPGEETYWVVESKRWADGPEVVGLIGPDGTVDPETPLRLADVRPQTRQASAAPKEGVPGAARKQAAALPPVRPATVADQPRRSDVAPPSTAVSKRAVVVLGSFRDPNNAQRLIRRFADMAPRVSRVTLDGKTFHRVIAGPFAAPRAKAVRQRAFDRGLRSVWTMNSCGDPGLEHCPSRTAAMARPQASPPV